MHASIIAVVPLCSLQCDIVNHPVLPVALRLERRPVLVLGGDDEAADKVPKLLSCGALVSLVAPKVEPSLAEAARRRELVWYARSFCESDLFGQAVVILAERDTELAARLYGLRRQHGFLLCAVDQPAFCDFFLMSTVTRGPIQLGITTGGAAPLLARRIRVALEAGMGEELASFAEEFVTLRQSLMDTPKAERKVRLEAALNGFAMEVALRYPEPVGASARVARGAGGGA